MEILKLKRQEAELAIAFQSKKQGKQGRRKSEEVLAVEEADRILMKQLKNKSEIRVDG